ncbi:MAG: hypothetical protein K8S97_05420 [Anaerolineae bacterium]|nr:hypothetical protein [Anaerolineae bacterium]
MSRRNYLLIAVLVAAWMLPFQRVAAQTSPQRPVLALHSGPGVEFQVIGEVPVGSIFFLTARNPDGTWLFVVTSNHAQRGWVPAQYITFSTVNMARLPINAEGVALVEQPVINTTVRTPIGFNLPVIERIDLAAYPVVGSATPTARAIYQRGQAMGRDPHQLAKVGDCATEHEYFLKHFTWDRYNLGEYVALQPVIDFYGESMDDLSYAASVGFVTGAVMDPIWANPEVCQPDESPLACEYRVHNPSVAVIMLGTQDVLLMTPEQFDAALREVVQQTVDANIVPILSTFPGNVELWEKSLQFNKIVINIALDFDIPLINLWLALEGVPEHGLVDGNHLSFPLTTAADLTQPNLTTGYPTRNLVTLQTLDSVWRSVTAGEMVVTRSF